MKKLKLIIGIIIGAILISGISVFATSQYLASQVEYNKNGQAKVSDALDDLYNKANKYKYTEQDYQDYGDTKYQEGISYAQNHLIGTKVELWRNNNTSNAFGEQTITLNSSIANYTHFIIQWKRNKNDNNTNMYEDIFSVLPFRTETVAMGGYTYGANGTTDVTKHFARKVFYVSSTQLKFGRPGLINDDYYSEDVLIPLYIYGVNLSY